MKVKRYWLKYDEQLTGHFMVESETGEISEVSKIWGAQAMDDTTRKDHVDTLIRLYDIEVIPEPEKPKRAYKTRVTFRPRF